MPGYRQLPGRHDPQRAVEEPHVPVRHRAGADAARLVRPVQPDRVDLRDRAEQDQHRAGERQQRIQPHPARPPQRRPEAGQEQRAGQDREDQDVHPVVPADDLMPGGAPPKIQNTRCVPITGSDSSTPVITPRLPPDSPSSGKMVPV